MIIQKFQLIRHLVVCKDNLISEGCNGLMVFVVFIFCIVIEYEGNQLNISRISRLDMGAYLCIASNGIPPSVSKRIKVSVDCKYQIIFSFFFHRAHSC